MKLLGAIIWNKEPVGLLGKSLEVYLKNGGAFLFKVTEAGADYIRGFDDEGLNLQIAIVDIDFMMEVL